MGINLYELTKVFDGVLTISILWRHQNAAAKKVEGLWRKMKICIPELSHDVTNFLLLYLECQSIESNSWNFIDSISKRFQAILPHLNLK